MYNMTSVGIICCHHYAPPRIRAKLIPLCHLCATKPAAARVPVRPAWGVQDLCRKLQTLAKVDLRASSHVMSR